MDRSLFVAFQEIPDAVALLVGHAVLGPVFPVHAFCVHNVGGGGTQQYQSVGTQRAPRSKDGMASSHEMQTRDSRRLAHRPQLRDKECSFAERQRTYSRPIGLVIGGVHK